MNDIVQYAHAVLSANSTRWIALTHTLPMDLLRWKPAPHEWSALECLQHLIDLEPIFLFRLRAFLAEQDFPAFDPDTQGTPLSEEAMPANMADAFLRLRAASLEELGQVTSADLGRCVRHEELGQVTLSEMLHEWAGHDLMHTVQAERAIMQPFIQGCGPWIKYFADHNAGTSDHT